MSFAVNAEKLTWIYDEGVVQRTRGSFLNFLQQFEIAKKSQNNCMRDLSSMRGHTAVMFSNNEFCWIWMWIYARGKRYLIIPDLRTLLLWALDCREGALPEVPMQQETRVLLRLLMLTRSSVGNVWAAPVQAAKKVERAHGRCGRNSSRQDRRLGRCTKCQVAWIDRYYSRILPCHRMSTLSVPSTYLRSGLVGGFAQVKARIFPFFSSIQGLCIDKLMRMCSYLEQNTLNPVFAAGRGSSVLTSSQWEPRIRTSSSNHGQHTLLAFRARFESHKYYNTPWPLRELNIRFVDSTNRQRPSPSHHRQTLPNMAANSDSAVRASLDNILHNRGWHIESYARITTSCCVRITRTNSFTIAWKHPSYKRRRWNGLPLIFEEIMSC